MKDLKNVYAYLKDIDAITDINTIKWNLLNFNRNNKIYEFIIMVCKLTLNSILLTEKTGRNKILSLNIKDSDYHSLFEAFISNYYKIHYKGSLTSKSETIKWQILENQENKNIGYVPLMHTDISLVHGKTELIIDAKYYNKVLSDKAINGYDKKTIHANNWYQINSYVINKKYQHPEMNISGMLLYAKTNESISPDVKVNIMGNYLYVRTIDMTKSFNEVEIQLQEIGKLVNKNLYKNY